MPSSALLENRAEWFLNYFYSVNLCLLKCILTITTITFIESLFLPAYLLSMDLIVQEIYGITLHEY